MKSAYSEASPGERDDEKARARARHGELVDLGLALDMTRGKPCRAQLDLGNEILTCVGPTEVAAATLDPRNYGVIDGLPEAKALFGQYMGVGIGEVIVGGNSSLALMHDAIVRALLFGVPGGERPWSQAKPARFLCPSPGYDRHFTVCEHLGIEMIAVPMTEDGPDMDEVEHLVASDDSVVGMWCVPRYSNPTGITYSDETTRRLAAMPARARDFRIFWDNAYAVHHLTDSPRPLLNILDAAKESGHPNRPLLFGSTSKVSFAGAGVAAMAASEENIADQKRHISAQSIGPDKVNQLRHVKFFGDMAGIEAHMKRHATIIRPKFEAVVAAFDTQLAKTGVAALSRPRGGYFFSLDALAGTARRIVDLAAEAGVKLTPAGATYPYGKDPNDRNIRLAPTFPEPEEIDQAMDVICNSVKLASLEKLG